MESIRILHLDPDLLMRSLLQEYLKRHQNDPKNEVAPAPTAQSYILSGVSSGEEALISLARDPYDIVLLELSLPKMSGVACISAIRSSFPDVKIVVLTHCDTINVINRCIHLGVFGFLSKIVSHERLHLILDIVSSGTSYFEGNSQMLLLQENMKPGKGSLLSKEDLHLLECLHKGMSRVKMSRHLGLAERTIDAHILVLQKKLGVGSRVELAVYAERHKLV